MVPRWLAQACSGQEKLDRTQRIACLFNAVRYRAGKGCRCWQVTVSISVLSAPEKALWLYMDALRTDSFCQDHCLGVE